MQVSLASWVRANAETQPYGESKTSNGTSQNQQLLHASQIRSDSEIVSLSDSHHIRQAPADPRSSQVENCSKKCFTEIKNCLHHPCNCLSNTGRFLCTPCIRCAENIGYFCEDVSFCINDCGSTIDRICSCLC